MFSVKTIVKPYVDKYPNATSDKILHQCATYYFKNFKIIFGLLSQKWFSFWKSGFWGKLQNFVVSQNFWNQNQKAFMYRNLVIKGRN